MSGPKCTEWEVSENRAREERARVAAMESLVRLHQQLAFLRTEAIAIRNALALPYEGDLTAVPYLPAEAASRAVIEAQLASAEELKRRLEMSISQARAHEQMAQLLTRAVNVRPVQFVTPDEAALRKAAVARKVKRLGNVASEASLVRLEELARDFMSACTAVEKTTAELNLDAAIQHLQESHRRRLFALTRVAEFRLKLRGYGGAEVDDLLAQLESVEAGAQELDEALEARVQHVSQREAAKADQCYLLDVLSDEFKKLGYEVGEQFTTVLATNGELTLQCPRKEDYGVHIALSGSNGRFLTDTRLVRVRDRQVSPRERQRRDLEAEESWCSEWSTVVANAAQLQVGSNLKRGKRPGEVPVPRAADVGDDPETGVAYGSRDMARSVDGAPGGAT